MLLLGNFIELCMFHRDFGWARFVRAIRNATVSARRPFGRTLWPEPFWKLTLRFAAPLLTLALFVDLLVADLLRAARGLDPPTPGRPTSPHTPFLAPSTR